MSKAKISIIESVDESLVIEGLPSYSFLVGVLTKVEAWTSQESPMAESKGKGFVASYVKGALRMVPDAVKGVL